jgi:fucose permease
VIALGFATFVCFGGLLVLVGSTQASLARELGIGLAETGLLASALAAGLGVGVVGSGPVVDRAPRTPLFVAACSVSGLALALPANGLATAALALALAGFGGGVLETLWNGALADRYRENAMRPLAWVHVGATLGAVAAPPLLGSLSAAYGSRAAFGAVAAGFALLAVTGASVRMPPPTPPEPEAPAKRLPWALLGVLGAATACYVGLESALTVFAVPYAREAHGLPQAGGVAAISAFWLGLGVGRVALAAWRGGVDARHLVAFGLVAAALLFVVGGLGLAPLAAAFGALGVVLGAVFPVLVALAAASAPHARATAAGVVAGCGAAGGFLVPWLTGALGDARGLPAAVTSLGAWALAMATCAWLARRATHAATRAIRV